MAGRDRDGDNTGDGTETDPGWTETRAISRKLKTEKIIYRLNVKQVHIHRANSKVKESVAI